MSSANNLGLSTTPSDKTLIKKELEYVTLTLCEMCPNTDQKKLRIWTLFTQCEVCFINSGRILTIENNFLLSVI